MIGAKLTARPYSLIKAVLYERGTGVFKRFCSESGGLTVEGALVLPMFLVFLISLLTMTRIAMVATALHMATTETVKTVSAHFYPIQQLAGAAGEKWQQKIPDSLQSFLGLLPQWQDMAQPLLCSTLTPLVAVFADSKVLKKDKLTVTKATVPEVGHAEEPYFGIEAEYTFMLPVPFVHKEIRLKSSAKERVWIGDSS
jgi:hypothetical protein